jgi:hypothetical protein
MRKDNFLSIKIEKFPNGSIKHEKDINSIMQHAYSFGWEVSSVDYNTGMIQFSRGKVKLNLYTTKFTLVIAKDGSQHSKKNLDKKRIKEIISLNS